MKLNRLSSNEQSRYLRPGRNLNRAIRLAWLFQIMTRNRRLGKVLRLLRVTTWLRRSMVILPLLAIGGITNAQQKLYQPMAWDWITSTTIDQGKGGYLITSGTIILADGTTRSMQQATISPANHAK